MQLMERVRSPTGTFLRSDCSYFVEMSRPRGFFAMEILIRRINCP